MSNNDKNRVSVNREALENVLMTLRNIGTNNATCLREIAKERKALLDSIEEIQETEKTFHDAFLELSVSEQCEFFKDCKEIGITEAVISLVETIETDATRLINLPTSDVEISNLFLESL